MRFEQRVLHHTLDISEFVNDFRTGTQTFAYTAGQYLYVGSIVPFNNLWFEVGVANDLAATLSVSMWFGQEWTPAVDLYDGTSGLFSTGRVVWNTDLDKGWNIEQRSSQVTGLAGTNIFNMYWARFSWSVSIKATTSLKYLGQKFANDDILGSYYPDLTLSSLKEQFESGKTNWDEQHYMSAELIVMDLKKRGVIFGRGQILDYSLLESASCHKLAEIVYTSFGPSYFEQRAEAAKYYEKQMTLPFKTVDHNLDGRLDPLERILSTRFMTR